MDFSSLADLKARGGVPLSRGPVCVVLAEDAVEVTSTVAHHLNLGFATVLLALAPGVRVPDDLPPGTAVLHMPERGPQFAADVVNAVIARLPPGTWLGYVYNAEYLFTPFCETRSVAEALAFCAEERRASVLCHVVDLYAPDLGQAPNGVDLEAAHFDRAGYYALPRWHDGQALERQIDVYGGLRWRFEEHIPWERRRIDRPALFRTQPDLRLGPDLLLSAPELNTYAAPWHHSMTAAIASFRAAKALATNPGSRAAIGTFWWPKATRFEWRAQQLLEHGFMEPGQWF